MQLPNRQQPCQSLNLSDHSGKTSWQPALNPLLTGNPPGSSAKRNTGDRVKLLS